MSGAVFQGILSLSNLKLLSLLSWAKLCSLAIPLHPSTEREMKAGWGDAVNKVVGILMTGFLLPSPLPSFWHSINDPADFAVWHLLAFLPEKGGGQNKGQVHRNPLPTLWEKTKCILIKVKAKQLEQIDGPYFLKDILYLFRCVLFMLLMLQTNFTHSLCISIVHE